MTDPSWTTTLPTGAYVVAALLFILSLSRHETARSGIVCGVLGMALALLATLLVVGSDGVAVAVILGALAVGALIGLRRAARVRAGCRDT